MSWDDNKFDDFRNRADDPKDVGWLISYWRIVPCEEGCKGNYRLESRQFDHLPPTATREEAQAKLDYYVKQRKEAGDRPNSRKNHVLFLSKVECMVPILDETGAVVDG